MATIQENAEQFESVKMRRADELETININEDVKTSKEFTDKDGGKFTVQYIERNGEQYRIPKSVLGKLKELMEVQTFTEFKVIRKGDGTKNGTSYEVAPFGATPKTKE